MLSIEPINDGLTSFAERNKNKTPDKADRTAAIASSDRPKIIKVNILNRIRLKAKQELKDRLI
jgi:hypothetical protein